MAALDATAGQDLAQNARAAALRIRRRFEGAAPAYGAYPLELTLEACCHWHEVDPAGGWLDPVREIWRRRDWRPGQRIAWRSQPFASHDDALARAGAEPAIAAAFVAETAAMQREAALDDGGRVLHPHRALPPTHRPLSIDFMHEFASRLASASALGGDPAWTELAVAQFRLFRVLLRDPESGLWHLGRGWAEHPETLCAGAWSRGHGWLLRGLVETLRWLPAGHSGREELGAILHESLQALRPLQDQAGLWHVLLHRPWAHSAAESSGSALIAYAIARAVALGVLAREPWSGVAARAIAGVCAQVDAQGVVHAACKGPGLLFPDGEALYLEQPIAPDDPHGAPCALYACLGAQLLAC